jgi:hypothetical protein
VLWADRDTAALALADARRAINRSEGLTERSGQLRHAKQALRNAERTYHRAERKVERGLDEDRELVSAQPGAWTGHPDVRAVVATGPARA